MTRKDVSGALRAACICQLADFADRIHRGVSRIFRNNQPARRAGALCIEPLEHRQLLAGVTLTDGVLSVSGADGQRNTLTVTPSGSNLIAKSNGISKTVAKSSVNSIKMYGGNWNDTIKIDSSIAISAYVDARAGNDSVSTGAGNDTVWGDVGNDTIYGNAGNDQLHGEDGNDYLDGGTGTNTVDGGNGTDTLKNASSSSSSGSTPTTASIAVSALELWNSDTDKKIQTISSGQTLDLAKLPAHLTLVAQGTGASVKFALDSNGSYRIENGKPWAIAGDISGNLVAWSVPTGGHTIKVTPYTKTGATGTAGATKSYTLNFTRTSSGGTGGSTGGGTGTGGIVPRDNSASTPNAVITAISSKTIHAGQSVHVDAMSSSLNGGTPLTARYFWDFGDSGSRFNTLEGFNAAHVYEDSGTYTVKLTLTNEAGKTDTATTTITVNSAGRKVYYVSNDGSDSASGTSPSSALKTFAKAKTKLADNVEILFNGGDVFDVKDSLTTYKRNVIIGSYGSGRGTLKYSGPKDYTSMIYLGGQGGGEVTVENLIFDSIYTGTAQEGMPIGVGLGGTGDAIVNCQFLNLGCAINAQANPSGMLVQDNTAPSKTGLRAYFVWGEGTDFTIIGNTVANSTHQHIVRIAGVDRLNISYNNFTNTVDSYDSNIIRGTLTIHQGSYAYIAGNTLNDGVAAVGPLGRGDGLVEKSARFRWAVLENNTFNNSQFLFLQGSEHTMFRNNVVNESNNAALEIEGYSTAYARGVIDVTIVNNTAVNNGSQGSFLRVGGDVDGINLINNLYLAPKLSTGNSASGAVFVYDNNLDSFRKITGNVWPMATTEKYAEGGINYVWPNWSNATGYKTPAEWDAYGVVIKDYFNDVSYSGFTPSSSSVAASAGVVWAGVFTDRNGKIRSNAGSWTAGAVEV